MGSKYSGPQSAGTVLVQLSYNCAYELQTALQNALGDGGGKKKKKKGKGGGGKTTGDTTGKGTSPTGKSGKTTGKGK